MLVEKNGKTLSNFPIEVSGRKCLKFGVSEFLSLLNLLPLRKNCTSTPGFRNIGVKYLVLVLKTLRVARIMDLSVFTICTTYNQQWGLKRQHSLKNAFKDAAALRNFHSLTQQANSNLAHKDRIAFVFLLGHLQNVMDVVLFKKNAHCLQMLKADLGRIIHSFNFQCYW